MSRLGKIARLPRNIREELNHRLADGETGPRLVDWLNTLPDTQKSLAANFGGRPITEQNLSDWRQGGFQDWLRHDEARSWVAQLVEQSDDLDSGSGPVALADRAAVPVLVALHGLLSQALDCTDPAEQRKTIFGVAQQLAQLRRTEHGAARIRLEQDRMDWQEEDRQRRAKIDAFVNPQLFGNLADQSKSR